MFADQYRVWPTATEANAYYVGKHLYTKYRIDSIYRIVSVELINQKPAIFHCINKLGEPVHIAARAGGGFVEDEVEKAKTRFDRMLGNIHNFEAKVELAIQNRKSKQPLPSNTPTLPN